MEDGEQNFKGTVGNGDDMTTPSYASVFTNQEEVLRICHQVLLRSIEVGPFGSQVVDVKEELSGAHFLRKRMD